MQAKIRLQRHSSPDSRCARRGEPGLGAERDRPAQRVQPERRIGPRKQVHLRDSRLRNQVPVDDVAERFVDMRAIHKHRDSLRQS